MWRRGLGRDVDRARHQCGARKLADQPRRDALAAHRQLRVELLLEPRGRLRAQSEGVRRRQDVRPVPGCRLEQHPIGGVRDLGHLPAHHAGDSPGGLLLVGDQDHLRVERALDAVQGGDALTVAGRADDQLVPRDAIEVIGVERLADQQHHVVRDVDDVRDRALPRGAEARPQPQRRGPHLDAREDTRGEPRAEVRHLDGDRRQLLDLAVAGRVGVGLPGCGRKGRAGDRVDLPRDPVDAEAVGAVRVEVQLEHVLGDGDDLGERRAGIDPEVAENHDPLVVVAELELVLREDHSGGFDAAQLGLAELLAARHGRAREGDGDGLTRGDVRRAADDRPLAVAGVHGADGQPVGVRVLLGGDDAADDEALGRRRADRAHAFHLDGPHREQVGDLLGRQAGIAVLAQP